LGPVFVSSTGRKPVIALTPVLSPFIWMATENGFLVGDPTTTLLISRDNAVTFYQTTVVGGQLVMLEGDFVQVQWAGLTPPVVVWFGGNTT
jgi:hypothetical protein